MKLECISIHLADIFHKYHRLQVCLKSFQLEIDFALIVWNYWNSVIDLEGVGISGIVDENGLGEISVQNSEILHMYSFTCVVAMLSEKSMGYIFIFWVKIIQNHICIARMASSENNNFKIFRQFLEEVNSMRSYIDSSIDYFSSREFYG